MRSTLLTVLLTAALLSGCVVEEPTAEAIDAPGQSQDSDGADAGPQGQQDPEAASTPSASSAPHGTPERTDGAITTGTDPQTYPGAWARRSITVTNGFGEATLGDLAASISSGSIVVRAADRADYLVEATLESRAGTEAEAKEILERTQFVHTDVLDGDTLFLEDTITIDPAPAPAPSLIPDGILVIGGNTPSVRVDLVITVPLAPAIDLDADSSSGDISASDLHGPALDLSTSSGDVGIALVRMTDVDVSTSSGDVHVEDLVASTFEASTSSGSVFGKALAIGSVSVSTSSGDATMQGAMDDIDADSSSGDLTFDAAPAKTGTYSFDASSGEVVLKLAGAAVHVVAGTSSGEIFVDVPEGEVIEEEEDRVEVASPGYDDAELRTAIESSTSSGDITVEAE